jgi:hypothetical protein
LLTQVGKGDYAPVGGRQPKFRGFLRFVPGRRGRTGIQQKQQRDEQRQPFPEQFHQQLILHGNRKQRQFIHQDEDADGNQQQAANNVNNNGVALEPGQIESKRVKGEADNDEG